MIKICILELEHYHELCVPKLTLNYTNARIMVYVECWNNYIRIKLYLNYDYSV